MNETAECVVIDGGVVSTPTVVLAAGHGTNAFEANLGFDLDVLAERGQILVTERMAPVGLLPANGVRQTAEGTVLIGTTNEDVGYDTSTTPEAGAVMVRRAIRVIPAAEIVARERSMAMDDVGLFNVRPPLKPISLQEPAALPE